MGETINFSIGDLRTGLAKLNVYEDQNFISRIRAIYEQFVPQPGTYVDSDGKEIHLPSGVTFKCYLPNPALRGSIGMILTVADESSGMAPNNAPDFDDFKSYQWSKFIVVNGEAQLHYHVPKAALARYSPNGNVYRQQDLAPVTIWLQELGRLSSILGPEDAGGFSSEDIALSIVPYYGVRPDGYVPESDSSAQALILGQEHSYDMAIADLRLNYDRYPAVKVTTSIPTSMGPLVGQASAVPLVLYAGVGGMLDSISEANWPPFLGDRDVLKDSFKDGHNLAMFVLWMVLPGNGDYAAVLAATKDVVDGMTPSELAIYDSNTTATTDGTDVTTRTYGSPAQIFDDVAETMADVGAWIVDFGSEMLLPALEVALSVALMAKQPAYKSGGSWSWSTTHKTTYEGWLDHAFKHMIVGLQAMLADGSGLEEAVGAIKRDWEDSSIQSLEAGNVRVPALEYMGAYKWDASEPKIKGHPAPTEAQVADVAARALETTTKDFSYNVIRSENVNPRISCLAPILGSEGTVQKQRSSAPLVSSKYKKDSRLLAPEGLLGGTPVIIASRENPAEPGKTRASIYHFDDAHEVSVIQRSAWPTSDGNFIDLTSDEYRGTQLNGSLVATTLKFTGYLATNFDKSAYPLGSTMDPSTLLFRYGADSTYVDQHPGPLSAMISGQIQYVEDENISVTNSVDPDFEFITDSFANSLFTSIGRAGIGWGSLFGGSFDGYLFIGVVHVQKTMGGSAGAHRGIKAKRIPSRGDFMQPKAVPSKPADPRSIRSLSLSHDVNKKTRTLRPFPASSRASSSSSPHPKVRGHSSGRGRSTPSSTPQRSHANAKGKGRRRK